MTRIPAPRRHRSAGHPALRAARALPPIRRVLPPVVAACALMFAQGSPGIQGVAASAGAAPPAAGSGAQGALSPSASVEAREHLRRGLELARQGLFDGAVAELRRYVDAVPADPEGHFHLGRALLETAIRARREPRDAIRELETALRLDPELDAARLQLAEIHGVRFPGVFRPDVAVGHYEWVLARQPARYDVRLKYARWLISSEIRIAQTGKGRVLQDSAWTMDLARHHLEKVIDAAPRASDAAIEARSLLAEVQFRSGEWREARATLQHLIEGFPERNLDLAPAWNTIGHCLWREGNAAKGAEAFRRAWEIRPGDAYLFDILTAYDRLGGFPPDVPPQQRFPMRGESIPSPPPNLEFEDIAARLRIDKRAGAGPAGWADYDGDGRYDLIACGCDTFCSLFRATPEGFEDATIAAGLTRLEPGFGAAWGDYDNDGDPDLYIARNGWNGPAPNSLLRNGGAGTFADVAAAAGVADAGSSFHAAWFDYDRDGWLDLIVSNGVYLDGSGDRLYRNNKDGTFADATAAAGLGGVAPFGTIGVAVGDYDDDGWPDIFMHGRMAPNRLYRNDRDGTFTDVAAQAGVSGSGKQNGYIALAADFDSDGDLDIFTGSLAPWDEVLAGYKPDAGDGPFENTPRLYRNAGNGTFTDASIEAGLRYPLGIMAAGTADLDNDGYPDIYLGTGNPELRRLEPNIFYHNRGGRKFEDMTRFTGLGALGKGHGIIFHDWDDDGDLDMFAELGGFYHGDLWESAFYLNLKGNRNNWLSVRLRQVRWNRDAVGARVTVEASAPRAGAGAAHRIRQVQEVTAGRGFSSTDPAILHFGLGRATRVERLTVRWPDGTVETREGVEANQSIVIDRSAPRDGAPPGTSPPPASSPKAPPPP